MKRLAGALLALTVGRFFRIDPIVFDIVEATDRINAPAEVSTW